MWRSRITSMGALVGLALGAHLAGCDGASPANTGGSGGAGGSAGGGGGAGGQGDPNSAEATEARLKKTLDDLAAIGSKRSGTPGGEQAGDYVADRFKAAGIEDVTFEGYSFLAFELGAHDLAVTIGGTPTPMVHDVFAYSGAGHVDAEVIDVGTGHENDYVGKDVVGKVVLVTRDPTFHRQAQREEVVKHGGGAMLYVSTSPDNLIQIGTVADPEDGLAEIPTLTIGADDGKKIKDALESQTPVQVVIDVEATVKPATGRNVVARVPGGDPSGAYVLIGAHYDTWFIGSTDNSTGVAVLLELAERVAHGTSRKLGVVLVGYDGEELGLFGGYDYLRKHVIDANEPMLAFVNLEMPGAGEKGTGLRALAHTNAGPIDPAATEVEIQKLYTAYTGMELVPDLFGGLIPTDIQGMYWTGHQGLTTYCETSYYHTPEDTPDKVDTAFLADASIGLDALVAALDDDPIASFDVVDAELWSPEVSHTSNAAGDLVVDVTAKDTLGATQAAANVRVWLDVDDFTRVFDETAVADAGGKAQVTIPKALLSMGDPGRYVHVTAGKKYPLSERIFAVPSN